MIRHLILTLLIAATASQVFAECADCISSDGEKFCNPSCPFEKDAGMAMTANIYEGGFPAYACRNAKILTADQAVAHFGITVSAHDPDDVVRWERWTTAEGGQCELTLGPWESTGGGGPVNVTWSGEVDLREPGASTLTAVFSQDETPPPSEANPCGALWTKDADVTKTVTVTVLPASFPRPNFPITKRQCNIPFTMTESCALLDATYWVYRGHYDMVVGHKLQYERTYKYGEEPNPAARPEVTFDVTALPADPVLRAVEASLSLSLQTIRKSRVGVDCFPHPCGPMRQGIYQQYTEITRVVAERILYQCGTGEEIRRIQTIDMPGPTYYEASFTSVCAGAATVQNLLPLPPDIRIDCQ